MLATPEELTFGNEIRRDALDLWWDDMIGDSTTSLRCMSAHGGMKAEPQQQLEYEGVFSVMRHFGEALEIARQEIALGSSLRGRQERMLNMLMARAQTLHQGIDVLQMELAMHRLFRCWAQVSTPRAKPGIPLACKADRLPPDVSGRQAQSTAMICLLERVGRVRATQTTVRALHAWHGRTLQKRGQRIGRRRVATLAARALQRMHFAVYRMAEAWRLLRTFRAWSESCKCKLHE